MRDTDIHMALLDVGGLVTKEDKVLNPDNVSTPSFAFSVGDSGQCLRSRIDEADIEQIAEKFWELYSQEKKGWTLDLDLLPTSS